MATKKKEATTESQTYTCPNLSCGRVFNNPIKAENLGLPNAETYYACPYCLTEITVEKSSANGEEEKEIKKTKGKPERIQVADETPTQSPKKTQGCAHHFGYLSERSTKEKIPEECIVCEDIVQCMLKKVTC